MDHADGRSARAPGAAEVDAYADVVALPATLSAVVVAVLGLTGCVVGRDGPVEYETEQGFQHRFSSIEQRGDGPLRFLSDVTNVGPPAKSAEFMVVLRDGARVVWVGRAEVEDIDTGEGITVAYEGDRPVPDGVHTSDWQVVSVQR